MKVEGLGVRITDLEVEGIVDISTDGEGCVAINFGNRIFRWSKSDTRKLRDALSAALQEISPTPSERTIRVWGAISDIPNDIHTVWDRDGDAHSKRENETWDYMLNPAYLPYTDARVTLRDEQ